MSNMKQQVLEDAFPCELRDAMTTFVIENRSVLDALQAILEGSAVGPESPSNASFQVRLVGGHEQAKILLDLAEENGLAVGTMSELGGPTWILLSDPNNDQVSLFVKCDFNFNDDVEAYTGYVEATNSNLNQEE